MLMMTSMLFAYGTLAPPTPAVATRDGWESDQVRGRLYDLGFYPALVDLEDPTADWVEGYVRPVTADELENQLDVYEAVADGLYERVETTTRHGRRVWVYIYAHTLPARARGPITRWVRPPSLSDRPDHDQGAQP